MLSKILFFIFIALAIISVVVSLSVGALLSGVLLWPALAAITGGYRMRKYGAIWS